MLSIEKRAVPAYTFLGGLAGNGAYTDCYTTEVTGPISLEQYVSAFYTTPLFKLERLILKWFVSKPSTDAEVRSLTEGNTEKFAAWTVEHRSRDQLLMCDFLRRTRSWFMIVPVDGTRTRLYFGSAVVPENGKTSLGFGIRSLLGFHQIYSMLLLSSARSRLRHP